MCHVIDKAASVLVLVFGAFVPDHSALAMSLAILVYGSLVSRLSLRVVLVKHYLCEVFRHSDFGLSDVGSV